MVAIEFKKVPVLMTVIAIVSSTLLAQSGSSVIDQRDGQEYRTKLINGRLWMLDNLNFASGRSIQIDTTLDYAPRGRFYHLSELDSACPAGWTVSRKEDWLSYFDHIVDSSADTTIKITENKMDEIVEIDYWGKINVFHDINPLEIKHTSWVEGGIWHDSKMMPPPNANFWVLEPQADQPQRTHVHVMGDIRIRMHRHKHHLKPKQEKKLRRFMVRCVELNP